jgi:hypothetical protein
MEKFCKTLADIKAMDNTAEKAENTKKIYGALQAFFNPVKTMKLQALDKGFGVTTDVAEINKTSYNFIMDSVEFDNLYEQAFMTVPLGEFQDSWETHTGKSGIAMSLVTEGDKIGVQAFTGSKITTYLQKYGEAIGITWDMINFRKIASLFELLTEARNQYLIKKSTVYYDLLKAAVGSNITTYQGAAADGETRRDILTFNVGTAALGNRMKLKVPNASTGSILCYANPDDEARIEAVFRAKTTDMAGALGKNKEVTKRPITRLYSYNMTVGSPVLVWPGRKNQKAEAGVLRQLTANDILIDSFIQAYYAYWGGVCADSDQFQQLTLG